MSLKCVAESILHDVECWYEVSLTKKKAIKKLCEKQIPKKIIFDRNDFNICPMCWEYVLSEMKYCPNCGQRIEL